MATQVEPAQRPPLSKHDRIILRQLEQTGGRVRQQDLLNTGLVLLAGILGYTVLLLSLDIWFDLPSAVRIGSFLIFAMAVLGYLGVRLWTMLFLSVNPYFAARQLEKTLPNAKGSVVNWLDLHDEPLPGAIRSSLSVKAAEDLHHADPERATHTNRPYWLLATVGVLFVALLLLFASGPGQFTSLLARSFAPFKEVTLVPKTEIEIVEPRGGDAAIGEKQGAQFRVRVQGRVPAVNQPGALHLHYRYTKSDTFQRKPFLPEPDGDWTTSLASDQIPSPGIWYKVVGGDAETPEYFIRVQSAPLVTKFLVNYNPRPYRPWAKQTQETISPYIEEYEGTEVDVQIIANRELQSSQVQIDFDDGEKVTLAGQPVSGNPSAMRFTFPTLRPGSWSVFFKSTKGEEFSDTTAHVVRGVKDAAPKVDLEEPTQEIIQLPVNGVLQLKGQAEDFDEKHLQPSAGIKKVLVQMKVVAGHPELMLQPKVYREGKSFQLAQGRYPRKLAYQDFVELTKLKDQNGKPFPTKDGMEIDYWLEAEDICDYPSPGVNLAKSKVQRIVLVGPQNQQQADKQKQEAQKQQSAHENKQDKSLDQESQAIEKQAKNQNGSGAGKNNDKDKGGQNGGGDAKNPDNDKAKDLFNGLKKEHDDKIDKNPGPAKKDGTGAEKKPGSNEPNPPNPSPDSKPSGDKKPSDTKPDTNKAKDQGSQPKPNPMDKKPDAAKGAGSQEKPQPSAKSGDEKDGSQATGDGSSQKQPPMPDGAAKPGGAKDQQGGDSPESTKSKGPPSMPEQGPAQAKGDASSGGDGPPSSPNDPPNTNAKAGPDSSKGVAKGKNPPPGAGSGQGGQPDPKQIADLLKQVNEAGPEQQKQFMEMLDRLNERKTGNPGNDKQAAEDMKNIIKKYQESSPESRKQIQKELEDLGKQAKNEKIKKVTENFQEILKKAAKGSDTTDPPNSSGNPNDGKNTDQKSNTKEPGSINTPKPGPNNTGKFDHGNPSQANKKFAQELGNLQLEQLRDKLAEYRKLLDDPEVQKRLKLTPEQKKWAEAYVHKLQDEVKKELLQPPGSGTSKIGSKILNLVGGNPGQTPAIDIGPALPPPEYADVFKDLITPSAPKKNAPEKK
jgi:hypothetical protein